MDTFKQVPIEQTAATLNSSTYTVWRMRMKLLHMLEMISSQTVVSGEVEMDEKYFLNSHKGESIENVSLRKRGGSATKRGLSNEQICLPTAVQRNGAAVLLATNTATQCNGDIMKLANHLEEKSMVWLDGKTAYNQLLLEKKCDKRVLGKYTTYERYGGVASKYINRYAALFVQVKEYTGCDSQEILLSIKRKLRQTSDFSYC